MMEMEKWKEQHEHSSKYLHLCSTEKKYHAGVEHHECGK